MKTAPGKSALEGVPTFGSTAASKRVVPGEGTVTDVTGMVMPERDSVTIAQQASTLISLLSAQSSTCSSAKAQQVWLGDGLGSLPKRIHDRMVKWEMMDMQDFCPRLTTHVFQESETQALVALPGFELTQPRKKPIDNIITWV